jgi:RimJ/RimL family protein N-acetyltransferase/catechol 2,3-dioxygenase-like lactoylglutathione lyase family enzyme
MPDDRPVLLIEPLHTRRLDLVPLDPVGDAPALHLMAADPEVHRYDGDFDASASVAETEQRLLREVVANGGTTWAIRLRGGDAIGTIGVFADQQTTIRGVGWSLARAYWRQGITSEAARVVVPYLLAQDGVDGLEAWVDSRNLGSLGVARSAGMSERGRLPKPHRDEVAQIVVMARAASPADPEVFGLRTTLEVANLDATIRIVTSVLGLHVAWAYPDPPTLAFLAVAPWSGSAGFQLSQADGRIAVGQLSVDVGVSVDVIHDRAVAAGMVIVEPPADKPWYRREFGWRLPDGHVINVSGPSSPAPPQN